MPLSWSNEIQNRIANDQYRIIVTSPDIALEHDPFHSLLSVILDEAHCISQWGDKFCPIYQRLGTLRAFVPTKVPFLATSA
ncbi:hypothetical protein F5878DRAFT_551829, partial [Lentinula raphanica]